MQTEEKQLTAMSEHIAELTELKNKSLLQMKKMGDADKSTEFADGMFTAYSNVIQLATNLLTTERQQLIDFYEASGKINPKTKVSNCHSISGESWYDLTFKTQ